MTKTKAQVKIIDCETGEEIIRDANAQEISEIEARQAAKAEIQAETEAKEAARQAILDRLGLSNDEAKLLLG